ncbi:MAG TPA: aminoglycoside adenylyltransferase domain-containing protein [Egibacteraceae bacterium]|nr:aminoglycoside adenylyltransferase domain-containing protein [Egibacteraceae bacterium]
MHVTTFAKRIVGVMDRRIPVSAAYLVGSHAMGDAAGDASDVDLLLVTQRRHDTELLLAAGEEVADAAQQAPGRGVEAVLYRAEVLTAPSHPLEYELNINAGPRLHHAVRTGGDPAFWFLLDVAIARQHAISLAGPAVEEVIGAIDDRDVGEALLASLAWHRDQGRPDADAVLNAARAALWLETRRWASKTAAGRWLADRADDRVRQVVESAVAARAKGRDDLIDPDAVIDRLIAAVAGRTGELLGR